MKKFLALLLVLIFALALASCSDGDKDPEENENPGNENPPEEVKAMTYAEYMAAELDSEVIIEAFVQGKQAWWDNKITVYLADNDGAYFVYEMACSEEDAAKLVDGVKIRVTGFKANWGGEIEVVDATFKFVEGGGTAIYGPANVTGLLGSDELIDYQNRLVRFTDMTVKAIEYKNDAPGDDIYVTLTKDGRDYDFCVEVYLTGTDSDVYQAAGKLSEGDVVDIDGFLYWYEDAPNPHITKIVKVLSYDEYMDAEIDDTVTVEAYVQATQFWWDNKITVYLADEDGAYFVYEMACSESDAKRLTPGTKIRVTGTKAIWGGEIEIMNPTFEFVQGAQTWIAPIINVTEYLGTEELINYQNRYVLFTDMTVKSIEYKNDEPGDDIYITFTKDGRDYDFCVERYLTAPDSTVYMQVLNTLEAGDVVDVKGFLYWYEGVNTHITELVYDALSYEEYMSAEMDDKVTVEAYVQATQSWWDNKITVYLADEDGAYFVYEMACSEANAELLTPGVKIRVTGTKGTWGGEIEIMNPTFDFVRGAQTWIAPIIDVTEYLGTDELIDYQNRYVLFTDMTVKSIEYKNGEPGDDIYITFTKDGADYSFCVERYLTGPDTKVYEAVSALKAGDVIDVKGFLYWYEGVNTHITEIVKVLTYDEYIAAEIDDEVTVEAFVQGTQSWWDNKITVYLQDENGGYFAYEMACSEQDAAKLIPGTKIRITGYKAVWAGEVEIMDGTFEFVDEGQTFVAEATDVTEYLGTENLINYQNQLVCFNALTVKSIEYKGGEPGDDIYLTFTKDGADYSFCVERYLTGPDTDLYKYVLETLKVGDVVNVEGFLYWYEGVNTHITAIEATN